MSTVNIQSQKLSTNWVAQLFQFRFPAGNTVYLANALEWLPGWSKFYNGQYDYVEIEMAGIRSDLTGALSEPSLRIASDKLWSNSGWAAATNGLSLSDYRGISVVRNRLFYNIGVNTTFYPQLFFVKSVDELSATEIVFTLTPLLGGDRLEQPSARKLETRPE